jgi:processive 1,2-diacylglycerol beta-glucosyltransferase
MTNSAPTDKRPHIHVVYEYGADLRPHSSAFLRLIRPFSHPRIQAYINTTFDLDYNGEPADLVIVDRLWRPDVTIQMVQELVKKIHQKRAKFAYSLDDNFFDFILENKRYPPKGFLPIIAFMLRQADCVLVSTSALRDRLLEYNPNIIVIPNQLDERLLVIRQPSEIQLLTDRDRIVIGCMGTFTHDEDFLMILPAIKAIHQHYPGRIEVQLIGVLRSDETKKALQELPVLYVYPQPEEQEYPLFMLWFTGHVHWDIAISPLHDTPFTRCKSDIKYLDYAAIGAAGIFSQSPAYTSTIHHKENGWIAENTPDAWEEALETLMLDSSLRLQMVRNASNYLYSQRILAQRAQDWVETVRLLEKND